VTAAERFRDERGILGVSIVRWILVIVLLGLVAIEGGSIIFTTIGLQNAADPAALEAADVWAKTRDFRDARDAAVRVLDEREQDEARIVKFEADGFPPFEVRMTVKKQASTLLIHRIGFLEGLAQVEVKAEAQESGV
jgi:hypothetical protein